MNAMFVKAIQLAMSKNDDSVPAAELAAALGKAEALARLEATFETDINASKARRGEMPTRLPKSRQSEIDGYSADARVMEAGQLASFETERSARQIVSTLRAALNADLKFWSTATKHTHPGDLQTVQNLVTAKADLRDALGQCLGARSAAR
jgi:hypothetical protein